MIDEYEDPLEPTRDPKGPKMANIDPWGAILRPFWDLWDPLVSPPGVLILIFYFLPFPLHNISKKIVKIFARVNWMGAK